MPAALQRMDFFWLYEGNADKANPTNKTDNKTKKTQLDFTENGLPCFWVRRRVIWILIVATIIMINKLNTNGGAVGVKFDNTAGEEMRFILNCWDHP